MKSKELKKQIEDLKWKTEGLDYKKDLGKLKVAYKIDPMDMGFSILVIEKNLLQAQLKARQQALKEVLEIIDEVDLKVFFTQLQDKKTGKVFDMPKELYDMFMQFWRYIEKDLKAKIKEDLE